MSQAAPNPYEEPQVTRSAYYHCPHCHAPADVVDAGEPWPQCARCGWRGLELRVCVGDVEPGVPPAVELEVPESARAPGKRLPASKRNLRILAETGYLVCRGCEQITEERNGCCILCGCADLEHIPPVFPKEESHE